MTADLTWFDRGFRNLIELVGQTSPVNFNTLAAAELEAWSEARIPAI